MYTQVWITAIEEICTHIHVHVWSSERMQTRTIYMYMYICLRLLQTRIAFLSHSHSLPMHEIHIDNQNTHAAPIDVGYANRITQLVGPFIPAHDVTYLISPMQVCTSWVPLESCSRQSCGVTMLHWLEKTKRPCSAREWSNDQTQIYIHVQANYMY